MPLRFVASVLIGTLGLTQIPLAAGQQAAAPAPTTGAVVVPSGTVVPLTLVDPIKHKSTQPGGMVRARVAFPITVGDQIAIPPGTLVEGVLNPASKGKKAANQPNVSVHFTRLVYANGYTVALDAVNSAALSRLPLDASLPEDAMLELPRVHGPAPAPDFAPDPQYTPVTNPYAHNGPTTKELVAFTAGPVAFVGVILVILHFGRPHGDYVVEAAGWQFQMTLSNPLAVDTAKVDAAAATPVK